MAKEFQGKIAVIGDHDSVLAFRAVGCEVFPVHTEAQTLASLRQVSQGSYGVIFLTEAAAQPAAVQELLARLQSQPLPVITLIPNARGSLGLAMAAIKANVEKAVGADVLFQEKR